MTILLFAYIFSVFLFSGAAAAIWMPCRSCTADEVRQCLLSTAKDLGTPGHDEYYGEGLVQTDGAYRCLVDEIGCCSETSTTQQPPSPVAVEPSLPTSQPTSSPTPESTCPQELSEYKTCFKSDLTKRLAKNCRECVNQAIPKGSVTCQALQQALCSAIDACKCGSCRQSIQSYLDCTYKQSFNCELTCDAQDITVQGLAIDGHEESDSKGVEESHTKALPETFIVGDEQGLL